MAYPPVVDRDERHVQLGRLAILALGVVAAGGMSAGCGGETDRFAGGRSASAEISAPAARIPPGRSLVCKLPGGAEKLPTSARHGLIDHLLQYPEVRFATPKQRARARTILAQLVASSERGRWSDMRDARRGGYDTRTAPRRAGDESLRYFHAERPQEPRGRSIFDFTRPKALIYANAPGRPLVLVGAMWSTRDGERGPTPAGRDPPLAFTRRLQARQAPWPQASCERQVPTRRAADPREQRDASRLVHGRLAERVRDPRPGARAVRRGPASGSPLPETLSAS